MKNTANTPCKKHVLYVISALPTTPIVHTKTALSKKTTTKKSTATKSATTKKTTTKKTVKETKEETKETADQPKEIEEIKAPKVEEVKVEPAKKAEAPKVEEKKSDLPFTLQVVASNGLYTFKGPAFDYPKNKLLPFGVKVTVTEVKGNWGKISDDKWIQFAKELGDLQEQYPEIAAKCVYAEDFAEFDCSSGYDLPLDDPWANDVARRLLYLRDMGE